MSIFKGMNDTAIEENEDRLGGGGGHIFPSNVYTATVSLAYAGASAGGAQCIHLNLKIDGKDYRETIYYTDKKGQNFYVKDGKKYGLPGFHTINDLCIVATDSPLEEQDTEEKQVGIYDYDLKREVPKAVHVLVDLIGQEVLVAIRENIEDIRKKNDDGVYVASGETRKTNSIEKFFHAEMQITATEARLGKEEPKFLEDWRERYKDVVNDKSTGKAEGSGKAGRPGGKPVEGAGGERKKSGLFNKK